LTEKSVGCQPLTGNCKAKNYQTLQQADRPKIVIYNLQGRVMATIPLNREAPQGDVMVECSDWSAGTYVVQLSTSKGVVGTRKVVVQR